MGTQKAERDWVDVANELLSRCHINRRLRKLTDCDANVFIALYESILGEKVPDYIEAPRCQEDDAHNVQSVIDSLSLDYLQISLSHITGENVVRGHKESIQNLMEIFDGLLEYLNEEISEESQNSEELNSQNEDIPSEEKVPELDRASLSSSGESAAKPSSHSQQSSNAEDVATNSEVIDLGGSARTFTGKREGGAPTSDEATAVCPPESKDALRSEPLQSAIPLQPPSQSDTPYSADKGPQPPPHCPTATGLQSGSTEEEAEPGPTESCKTVADTVATTGGHSPSRCQSPVVSEKPSQQRDATNADTETLEPTNGGHRRVLFRTQPDVLFLTLQDPSRSPPDTEEEEEEDMTYRRRVQNKRTSHRDGAKRGEEDVEPLSYRRQRNKKAEEELHQISDNLSHRLEELDQMLKRVLSETEESGEIQEEDKQSHQSNGITERCRTSRQLTDSCEPEPEFTQRTRSLSPSPPRSSPQGDVQDSVADSFFLHDGRQSNLTASDQTKRRGTTHRLSQRKLGKYLLNKLYQEELERYEDKEQVELSRARIKAQEAEREYRETILKDASTVHRQSPVKPKAEQRSQRKTTSAPGRRPRDASRKAPQIKVKENDLLPVLLEELPHLHISPHALGQMWEQQMQQVDQLHNLSSLNSKRRGKLSVQLEEAQRKHDLLVGIVQKEQEHSRRLRNFKERIQQQKSTQNKLREQRQQIARAKKYHTDYHVQHRARLMRARTKEERMFRQLFEEGLAHQKDRLREHKAYAREQQLEHQRRHQDHITSLENYYKDQFSLLAEKLAQERQEIQVRKKAQEKALLKMKQELRSRMEHEIRELQKIIVENDEDDYFEDLEVQRLRHRIHLASFNYNTSYLH